VNGDGGGFGSGAGSRESDAVSYRVVVRTGGRRGAGTASTVSLLIRTGSGTMLEQRLNASGDALVDGSCRDFLLDTGSFGRGGGDGASGRCMVGEQSQPADATSLSVWHDGVGYANAWFLDDVTVHQTGTGE
jgi:hypothetical protein